MSKKAVQDAAKHVAGDAAGIAAAKLAGKAADVAVTTITRNPVAGKIAHGSAYVIAGVFARYAANKAMGTNPPQPFSKKDLRHLAGDFISASTAFSTSTIAGNVATALGASSPKTKAVQAISFLVTVGYLHETINDKTTGSSSGNRKKATPKAKKKPDNKPK